MGQIQRHQTAGASGLQAIWPKSQVFPSGPSQLAIGVRQEGSLALEELHTIERKALGASLVEDCASTPPRRMIELRRRRWTDPLNHLHDERNLKNVP